MCGITGYWGSGSTEILSEMRDSLTHRGPDSFGSYENGKIGLAHRRLSIVDLSPTGHQPMQSDDGAVSVVFNGEIYNFNELRTELLADVPFKGTSDTEVLLQLYLRFGESFLGKLRGMFAIALYDTKKNILLLARDHLGKKPLFWSHTEGTLIFGSELKALRKHPHCPTGLHTNAIAEYLVYEYIPAPHTIYEDIYKLLPGTYLIYDGEKVVHKTFHTLSPSHETYEKDFISAQNELYELVLRAVEKRMVADVPVGVFLSGGLDSSTIAYFAQKVSSKKVKTFSIGFEDSSFDERMYAKKVASELQTEHYEAVVGPKELEDVIPKIPFILDEPMADSSIIPTSLLSMFARTEVTVALGGDGADEVFFGYDTFRAHELGSLYERVPVSVKRGIERLAAQIPVSHSYMSFDFKVKKFLSGFRTTKERRNTYWLSAFLPEELPAILNFPLDTDITLSSTDQYYAHKPFWDGLQYEYLRSYLADDILVKTDRASMAYGLEVRAPFLDLSVVDFGIHLKRTYKNSGMSGKYILKKMMDGLLPHDVIYRKKKGFNIPIGSWIKGDLSALFTHTILDGALVSSGLFKREGLAILLQSHIDGKVDNRKKLWSLFVLALWMEEWTS